MFNGDKRKGFDRNAGILIDDVEKRKKIKSLKSENDARSFSRG